MSIGEARLWEACRYLIASLRGICACSIIAESAAPNRRGGPAGRDPTGGRMVGPGSWQATVPQERNPTQESGRAGARPSRSSCTAVLNTARIRRWLP